MIFIRFTETPERDIQHPVSFYAVSEDRDYLQDLDTEAEIVPAFDGMWGIPTEEEGLCGYGPYDSVEAALEDLPNLIGGEPWFDLPARLFEGDEAGTNELGDTLFIPLKLYETGGKNR